MPVNASSDASEASVNDSSLSEEETETDALSSASFYYDGIFRILCISSYNFSHIPVRDELLGFEEGLGDLNAVVDYEFMDANNYYETEDFEKFYEYISYKIRSKDYSFDLVVLTDDSALAFGTNYRAELFGDIPIVFFCVNSISDSNTADSMPNVAGIAEVYDYEKNLALWKDLFPERKKIVAIVDSTSTGAGSYVEFMKFIETHPEIDYSIINTSYYSTNGLKKAFSEIGEDSIIVCLDFLQDGSGKIYAMDTAMRLMTSCAPTVPVFRMASADIENGVLGGVTYSYRTAGKKAGEIARSVSYGTNIDQIPLNTEPYDEPVFDYKELNKFGISVLSVPKDATILNEPYTPITFYRENMVISNLVAIIIILLTVMILILSRQNRRRYHLVNTDFLTKLPNRNYINNKLHQASIAGQSFGILMIDVDDFKKINDNLGHPAGDELLIEIARRLGTLAEKDIIFARIGGDEFMCLIMNPDLNKALKVCRDIMTIMQKPCKLKAGSVRQTVSMGFAMYPDDTNNPDRVMSCADMALYRTKAFGKNGYTLYGYKNPSR
ncbi:ABC transporter substrate binding protein [Butyrivibrio sp. MC2013]|uniref:ABC transporter substrate binding protein n=1 Tax=Butyrivibrio sp. MC2013 TaxID=1280686 RepID=UPI00047DAE23|nr:ABC transporter substrate binding protein [Butyrivibrio sp. MC2013]